MREEWSGTDWPCHRLSPPSGGGCWDPIPMRGVRLQRLSRMRPLGEGRPGGKGFHMFTLCGWFLLAAVALIAAAAGMEQVHWPRWAVGLFVFMGVVAFIASAGFGATGTARRLRIWWG